MKKFPFSNAGFHALQKERYALNDAALDAVANKVTLQFTLWVSENFELSASQLSYMQSLSPKMIRYLASLITLALINRLPINLIKPENQINTLLRGSKLIRPTATITASSQGANGFETQGSLDIEISY